MKLLSGRPYLITWAATRPDGKGDVDVSYGGILGSFPDEADAREAGLARCRDRCPPSDGWTPRGVSAVHVSPETLVTLANIPPVEASPEVPDN